MRYAENQLTRAALSFNSNGDNTIVAGVTGKQICVYELVLYAASSVAVTVKSTSTGLTGAMTLTNLILPLVSVNDLLFPHLKTAAGGSLVINLSSGVQCSGYIVYKVN